MKKNLIVGMMMAGLSFCCSVTHASVAQLSEKQFSRDIQWVEPDEGERALESFWNPGICEPPPDCTITVQGVEDEKMPGMCYGSFIFKKDPPDDRIIIIEFEKEE